jgi:hypothetical protein
MSVPKRFFILSTLLCGISTIHAASPFPHGCEPSGFGFQEQFITFNDTGRQKYFLVENYSSFDIELERISITPVFMTPKLQTKIASGQWAAFASDVDNTHFKCGVRNEQNDIEQISCAAVLHVCQYPRVRFALSNMGTYWVSTNKPQIQVIKESTNKGIYLKW